MVSVLFHSEGTCLVSISLRPESTIMPFGGGLVKLIIFRHPAPPPTIVFGDRNTSLTCINLSLYLMRPQREEKKKKPAA